MNFFSRVLNAIWSGTNAIASTGYTYFRLGTAVVNPTTSMQSSAFARGVNIICGQVGKLEFGVFDRSKVQVFDRLHYLLNTSPDNEKTAHSHKTLIIDTAIRRGNYFAQIRRNAAGAPIKMIAIESSRVSAFRDKSGDLFYKVSGTSTNSTVTILPAEDMFHIPNIHLTEDGLMGHSTVTYARDVLGINLSLTNTVLNFFKNVSLPIGVLTTTGNYGTDEQARMKSSFNKDEDDGNVDAPGGIAVLNKSYDYKLQDYKEDILQFINSRKFSITEIGRYLNINPAMLYDPDVIKTAKMQEQELALYKDCLSIWISKIEQEVNLKLLNGNYADKYCKADVRPLLLEDHRSMGEYYTKMHQMGVYNADEIRAFDNLPSIENGQGQRRYIAANNLKPIDRIDEIIDADIAKGKPDVEPKDVTPKQIENALLSILGGGKSE